MNDKIEKLEQEGKQLQDQQKKLKRGIDDLNAKIGEYTKEHQSLIAKIDSLEQEKEKVTSKITKSENLMMGLGTEKSRWETSSK